MCFFGVNQEFAGQDLDRDVFYRFLFFFRQVAGKIIGPNPEPFRLSFFLIRIYQGIFFTLDDDIGKIFCLWRRICGTLPFWYMLVLSFLASFLECIAKITTTVVVKQRHSTLLYN